MASGTSTVPATVSTAAAGAVHVYQPRASSARTTPPKRQPRVRPVYTRNLDTISGTKELIASVMCAMDTHSEIYEHGPAKELHGDINPNSIVIFDHPPAPRPAHGAEKEDGDEDDAPWDSPYGPSTGAMVYCQGAADLARDAPARGEP